MENSYEEVSDIYGRKLIRYRSNTTSGTGLILPGSIYTESEYARTVNTTTNNNDKVVKYADVIYSDSDCDEGSNYDMEDSDFLVDDGDMPNFYE